jgi:hypothetical protein
MLPFLVHCGPTYFGTTRAPLNRMESATERKRRRILAAKNRRGVADLERAHCEGIAEDDHARYFNVSMFMRFVS